MSDKNEKYAWFTALEKLILIVGGVIVLWALFTAGVSARDGVYPESVECPPSWPTVSTPDGAVTCCQVARMWQFPARPPAAPTRVGWDCPAGWQVTGGQVVPWSVP